jgi:hypothetical protein
VVNKKKKAVLVQELRDRKYEAFPPRDDKKVKSTDEELGKDDAEEEEDEASGGARDYDYLLSVRPPSSLPTLSGCALLTGPHRCLFGRSRMSVSRSSRTRLRRRRLSTTSSTL